MTKLYQLCLFGDEDLAQPVDRDRWCTPPWVIELVRAALGDIDLDPASNARAQSVVDAHDWYSLDVGRDGLVMPWAGRVWCNPPYSRGLIELFADRIVEEWGRGEIDAMLVLVNSATSTKWWHQLARHASAIIYPDHRLAFWHAETRRTAKGGRYDQTLFAFGLVDLEPLKQLGLVCPKMSEVPCAPDPVDAARRKELWGDLAMADEMAGSLYALLDDLTMGWPGWSGGEYDAAKKTPARDEREVIARLIFDQLRKAGALNALMWEHPEPLEPTKRHIKMWNLLSRARDELERLSDMNGMSALESGP